MFFTGIHIFGSASVQFNFCKTNWLYLQNRTILDIINVIINPESAVKDQCGKNFGSKPENQQRTEESVSVLS